MSGRTKGTPQVPTKDCAVCGRTITWRKKWERDWEAVKYCSDACRRRAKSSSGLDADLETTLRRLLERTRSVEDGVPQRGRPSGRRRGLARPHGTRAVGRAPARAAGEAEITQGGRVVDPSTAKGPIRVRLR